MVSLTATTRRLLGDRGSLRRAALVVATGSTIGQVIIVVAAPLLTRLYEPTTFGSLAVFASFLSIAGLLSTLRLDLALLLPADDDNARRLFALGSVAVLTTTLILAVGIRLVSWTNPDSASIAGIVVGLGWFVPAGFALFGVSQLAMMWTTRLRSFHLLARARVTRSVAQASTQVGLGLVAPTASSLVLGYLLGQVGALLALLPQRPFSDLRLALKDNRRSMAVLRRHRRFPLVSSWSSLINSVGIYGLPLFIGGLYGPAAAAFVALAQRVIGNPMALLRDAVSQVYVGEAARLLHEDPSNVARLFRRTTRRLLLIGLPLSFAIAAVAPRVFGAVFGAEWETAGDFVRALTPFFAAQFVVTPISSTLPLMQRQGLQLAWDVLRSVSVVCVLLVANALGADAVTAVWAVSFSSVGAYVILLVLVARALRRLAA